MIDNFTPAAPGFQCATSRRSGVGPVLFEPVVGWTLIEGTPVPWVALARGGVALATPGWVIVESSIGPS